MLISEIYAQNRGKKPVISFEVFPPKTDAAFGHLQSILPELVGLGPDFMTVTYGALGSTQERTLEIASLINQRYSMPTACHLTCVGSSKSDLDQIIKEIEKAGIQNIVALRGDPPQGETEFRPPPDGLAHGNELVAHIRQGEREGKWGRFGIAVAGYPEKHLEAPDMETDLNNLKRKVDAGADCVVTQLFYENDDFFAWEEKVRKKGIDAPLVPGLLPILSAKQIVRITSMCGSCLPNPLKAELEQVGDDTEKAEAIGVKQCAQQAKELVAKGVPGIHFYVLNKVSHMKQIMAALRQTD